MQLIIPLNNYHRFYFKFVLVLPVSNANLQSSNESPPEKRARIEPTNFGHHEQRFPSPSWVRQIYSPKIIFQKAIVSIENVEK